MSGLQGHASRNPRRVNPSLPLSRSADEASTLGRHPGAQNIPDQHPGFVAPHGSPFLIRGTQAIPSYERMDREIRHVPTQNVALPDAPFGHTVSEQPSRMTSTSYFHDLPPPGLYPNDRSIARRPPMIMEDTIREFKERTIMIRGSSSRGRGKDIHRHLRVVHVIGEFVREHNDLHSKDPQMQYRWYGTDRTDSQITSILLSIIEDTAYAIIPHLYSKLTYNDAQRRDGASMESLVARVTSHEMFDPLTQTLRAFGIRKLIQEKMDKKKTTNRRQKRISQIEHVDENGKNAIISLMPRSDDAVSAVPDLPAEVHNAVPASDLSLPTDKDNHGPITTDGHQYNNEQETLNVSRNDSTSVEQETLIQFPGSSPLGASTELPLPADGPTIVAKNMAGKARAKTKKGKVTKNRMKASKENLGKSTTAEITAAIGDQKDTTKRKKPTAIDKRPTKKSRKRKTIEKEGSKSGSSTEHTDSESCEQELASLKKRLRELEKRKAKGKGNKNNSC